jgi:hypothetical protein
MGDATEAIYAELPLGRYIRLLYLAPGTGHDAITAHLSTFPLTSALPYDALSYVWGHSGDVEPIEVNNSTVTITKNLKAALARVRYADKPHVVWADAICINQRNIRERGHHVGFMGAIYSQAKRVLVCLGPDEDGGARDVAELVAENHELVSKYGSVEEMPIFLTDDPILNDVRRTAVATLARCVWWTRTWVIQEVGLAKDPWVLYGDCEFSYRKLMTMAMWVDRCAGHLLLRAGVEFNSIHIEWVDWSPEWEKNNWTHERSFLDLMNQGSWLGCADHRDHVFAMLGHPFAQLDSESETLVKPDYSKDFHQVYLDLALQLLKEKKGHRLLSAVEHNENTINEDFPSWVPYWTVQETMTNFGIYTGFPYDASSGIDICALDILEKNCLQIKGVILGAITSSFKFTTSDMAEPGKTTDEELVDASGGIFGEIWGQIQENKSASAYQSNYLTAFCFTLIAGCSGYDSAEANLHQHQENFAAYINYRLGSTPVELSADLQGRVRSGDREKFWLDMRIVCRARSFAFTENGYYVLGPAVMEPEDLCCIIFGAHVPLILRRTETEGKFKLVGEAYIHGVMHGEAKVMMDRGDLQEETITLC